MRRTPFYMYGYYLAAPLVRPCSGCPKDSSPVPCVKSMQAKARRGGEMQDIAEQIKRDAGGPYGKWQSTFDDLSHGARVELYALGYKVRSTNGQWVVSWVPGE
jgi:hypothetical protein